MNKILITVSAIALCSMIITGIAILKPVNVKIDTSNVGALVGPDIYHALKVHGAFNYGGKVLATTTAGSIANMATMTLTGSLMADYDYFDVMANVASTTWTLPATSTMVSLLPDIGSTRRWLFHNATSSSAIDFKIIAGTGMDLVSVTANDDIIDPGEWMQLTCTQIYYRTADNENIMCIVDELANSD